MMSSTLRQKLSSFSFLNMTQFLGALNDNIYKLLIAYFLIGLEGKENSASILAIVGAVFVIPFLLFSAPSGILADRYSKSTIIFATKIMELVTMSLGLLGFLFHLEIGSYIILFLMAAQSAIFSPSKYGIIPEIVPNERVSQANGLLNFFTYFAIILGTFLASFVIDVTHRNFVIASMLCIVIALIGLGTSYFIEYTPPSGSEKKVSPSFISDIYQTLKRVWFEAPAAYILMTCIFSSAYFLFVGSYIQLSIIPYAMQILGLSDVQGGYLFLITALGIGSGSYLAGKISGKGVELGLIPIAAIGMALCFYLLDGFSFSLPLVCCLVLFMGICGGLFLVPLDTYIQVNSPSVLRGQVIGATNFLSFLFVLFSSLALMLFTDVLGLQIDQSYLVVGSIAALYALFLIYLFFDFMTRFLGMILCRLHFKLEIEGTPSEEPAIYITPYTAWNDTLLLLGSQRRRVRFFISEDAYSRLQGFYKIFRTIHVPVFAPLENNRACLLHIRKSLKKGFSICLFSTPDKMEELIERMKHSEFFHEMLEDGPYHFIPLHIEKGEKVVSSSFLKKVQKKIHCPAKITFGSNALPGY